MRPTGSRRRCWRRPAPPTPRPIPAPDGHTARSSRYCCARATKTVPGKPGAVQLIRPVRGFKTPKTAYATIKGFEVMRALRMGQAGMFAIQSGSVGEARIVERAFDIGPCALTEVMALLQERLTNPEP